MYMYIYIYIYTLRIYTYIYIEGLDPIVHIDMVWRKHQVVCQMCAECGAICIRTCTYIYKVHFLNQMYIHTQV